jgi:putative DNA primase/helicase
MPDISSLTSFEGPAHGAITPAIKMKDLNADATQLRPVPAAMGWPADLRGAGCVATYPYYDENGRLLTVLGRYQWPEMQETGRIEPSILPFTAWQQPDGSVVWAGGYLLGWRPLYGLLDLLARRDAPVILSEDENGAEAIGTFLPTAVSVTWMGGVKAIDKADLSPLKGRDVWIFPRHDAPGRRVAAELIKALRAIGVSCVWILDIAELSQRIPGVAPTGCDMADLIDAGLTADAFHAQIKAHPALLTDVDLTVLTDVAGGGATEQVPVRASAQAVPDGGADDGGVSAYLLKTFGMLPDLPDIFEIANEGVFKHVIDRRGLPLSVFVCSPMFVVGRTRRGSDGTGWGYLVTFRTPTGQWDTVVIPARKLAGDGREVREILADLGVICAQDGAGRMALSESIAYSLRMVKYVIDVTDHPGWVGNVVFALPDRILIAPGSDRRAILDMEEGRQHRFCTAGTIEGWQDTIKLVEHNSRGNLAVCMAFAGCLMRPLGAEGGGIHLWGRTSMSKTSLAMLAGAAWGGNPRDGFVRSWRVTDNGLEGLAAIHNDTFLILDELALVDADRLAEILYMLSNGHGKARATKTGGVQPITNWVSMLLSTGEITTAAHIKSGNAGKRGTQVRIPGGVGVRMVDLPITLALGTKRSFEDLGPFDNEASLANHIKAEAKVHYGHAGPAFVAALLADRDEQIDTAKTEIEQFIRNVSDMGDDPEVGRVAARFGLIAAAGEMAIRFGILPWREGAASKAARTCYAAWRESRGDGTLSHDETDAVSTLKQFFELHGASRFEPLAPGDADDEAPAERLDDRIVREQCGYRRYDLKWGTTYYVTPEAWRSEICTVSRDPDFVARVALGCGALVSGEGTRLLKNVRLPDHPKPRRVYVIRPDLLP